MSEAGQPHELLVGSEEPVEEGGATAASPDDEDGLGDVHDLPVLSV